MSPIFYAVPKSGPYQLPEQQATHTCLNIIDIRLKNDFARRSTVDHEAKLSKKVIGSALAGIDQIKTITHNIVSLLASQNRN